MCVHVFVRVINHEIVHTMCYMTAPGRAIGSPEGGAEGSAEVS